MMAVLAPCARCGAQVEPGDFRCAVCALAIRTAADGVAAPSARIVRCDGCNAAMAWQAEAGAPACAFCGSRMHVETEADPPEQAQFFLPFQVSPEAARAALQTFLSTQSFFRPSDLAKGSSLDALVPLYWPAWLFQAEARVSWTADTDFGSGRADWAPRAGQFETTFSSIAISASRGMSEGECASLIPAYALQTRASDARGPEGVLIERFDTTRSGARRRIAEAIQRVAASRAATEVPGTRQRKLQVVARLERLSTERYALPAYVMAYRYRKKLYRVVVHGQRAEVLLGHAPTSPWKVLLVVGVSLAVLLLLSWLALR